MASYVKISLLVINSVSLFIGGQLLVYVVINGSDSHQMDSFVSNGKPNQGGLVLGSIFIGLIEWMVIYKDNYLGTMIFLVISMVGATFLVYLKLWFAAIFTSSYVVMLFVFVNQLIDDSNQGKSMEVLLVIN